MERQVDIEQLKPAVIYEFYSECIFKEMVMGSLVMSHGGHYGEWLGLAVRYLCLCPASHHKYFRGTGICWDVHHKYLIFVFSRIQSHHKVLCSARRIPQIFDIWQHGLYKRTNISQILFEFGTLYLTNILHCPLISKICILCLSFRLNIQWDQYCREGT